VAVHLLKEAIMIAVAAKKVMSAQQNNVAHHVLLQLRKVAILGLINLMSQLAQQRQKHQRLNCIEATNPNVRLLRF
jgi:hypothetical protein